MPTAWPARSSRRVLRGRAREAVTRAPVARSTTMRCWSSSMAMHDRNLARIEQLAECAVSRARANQLAITGETPTMSASRTRRLTSLYERLKRGLADRDGRRRCRRPLCPRSAPTGDERGHPHAQAHHQCRARPASASYLAALRERDMVFALGPAGTGKTYLAVAMGVSLLLAGKVERIVLSRPAVEAGERLGFLPGDMKEKIDPYLRPLYDALHDMLPAEQIAKRMEVGRDRDRAARLHARPHAGALLRHPRRGAEHHADADAHVPDPARRGLAHGRDRRSQPDRPAGRPASGLADAVETLERCRGHPFRAADLARTWCATIS